MGNYLDRTTKQYRTSTSPASLSKPLASYIEGPDLSAVIGQPSKYWKITDDVVSLMSVAEQNVVNVVETNTQRAAAGNSVDSLGDPLVAMNRVLFDYINGLLANAGLPTKTVGELKQDLRDKVVV